MWMSILHKVQVKTQESASRTENMPNTETVIIEGNSEDMVIEDDTAQSIGSNPQLQSGTEELIIIDDTDTSD